VDGKAKGLFRTAFGAGYGVRRQALRLELSSSVIVIVSQRGVKLVRDGGRHSLGQEAPNYEPQTQTRF
jgi:hypothetical protein